MGIPDYDIRTLARTHTDLNGADLSGANVTHEQLDTCWSLEVKHSDYLR